MRSKRMVSSDNLDGFIHIVVQVRNRNIPPVKALELRFSLREEEELIVENECQNGFPSENGG